MMKLWLGEYGRKYSIEKNSIENMGLNLWKRVMVRQHGHHWFSKWQQKKILNW